MADGTTGPHLPEALLEHIFNTEILDYLGGTTVKPATQDPELAVVVAQYGASTGIVANALWSEFLDRDGIVYIAPDELRAFHPDYDSLVSNEERVGELVTLQRSPAWIEHTDHCARWWTFHAIEHFVLDGYNVALDDRFVTKDDLSGLAGLAADEGYHVRVSVMATPPVLSRLGIIETFVRTAAVTGTGPWVDPEEHDASASNARGVVVRAEHITAVSQIDVHTVDGRVYDQDRDPRGGWRPAGGGEQAGHRPTVMMAMEHARVLTVAERVAVAERLASTLNQLADAGVGHRGVWAMAGDIINVLAALDAEPGRLPALGPPLMQPLNDAMLRVLDTDTAPGGLAGPADGTGHLPEPPPPPEPDVGPEI